VALAGPLQKKEVDQSPFIDEFAKTNCPTDHAFLAKGNEYCSNRSTSGGLFDLVKAEMWVSKMLKNKVSTMSYSGKC
jgi:hypothetical protein